MEELLKELKALNLPKAKYAVFGSGPMSIRGIRESADIDIIVTDDIFEEFRKKKDWRATEGKKEMISKGKIEMIRIWPHGKWNIQKLIQEAEIIDEIPFVRLEHVLRWKKLRGLEKDLKDIKLIEEYLNK